MRRTYGVGVLFLVVTASIAASATRRSEQDAAVERMIDWLRTHPGFEAKVRVGYNAQGVRGLFAITDINQGEAVLSIPPTAILNVGGYHPEDAYMEPTARLLAELKDPHSRLKPYLDTLPKPDEVLSMCNMPEEYLDMLPAEHWREAYTDLQTCLKNYLAGHNEHSVYRLWLEEALGPAYLNVTLDELRYACAASCTRVLDVHPRQTHLLIPLFDMGNHYDDCDTFIGAYGNHFGPEDNRYHLVANKSIKAGEEVCYTYKDNATDDHMLFGYGFLPSLPTGAAPKMLQTDTWEYTHAQEGAQQADDEAGAAAAAAAERESDPGKVAVEITRLLKLLGDVDAHAASHPNPPPLKGHEYAHAQLVELQRRRRAALVAELKRLGQLLQQHGEEHQVWALAALAAANAGAAADRSEL